MTGEKKMTNTHDTYTTIQNAMEVGQTWGEQEIELWKDQHDGSFAGAPAWTRGTYCGELPADETRELIEAVIDITAEWAWNTARQARPDETESGMTRPDPGKGKAGEDCRRGAW